MTARNTMRKALVIAAVAVLTPMAHVVAEPAVPAPAGPIVPVPHIRPIAQVAPVDIEALITQPIDTWSPIEAEAATFAGDLSARAFAVSDNAALGENDKRSAFRSIVADSFNMKSIARVLLGRNRDKLDDHQLANYQSVVDDYIVPFYAMRLGQACNAPPSIVAVQKRKAGVFVRTAFSAQMGAPPTYVDWLVGVHDDGTWRVLDVAIDGVSLAQAKMEEFSAVIANRGPDAFLELLHEQAGDPLPEPMTTAVFPPSATKLAKGY